MTTVQLRDPDALTLEAAEIGRGTSRFRWIGQPLAVGLAVGVIAVYIVAGDHDDETARQLAWGSLADLTLEHLQVTLLSSVLVLGIAFPLGVLVTRRRARFAAPIVVGLANIGQATPPIGLLVLLALWLGIGFWTAVIGLSAFAILPVLRNTITGIQQVDPQLVEAGRGMGMSAFAVLLRVEIPLAVPVILAGVRVALVLLIGTATLAGFIDGGGYGLLITAGIKLGQDGLVVVGAVLVAALALLIDWLGRIVEEVARPKGLG